MYKTAFAGSFVPGFSKDIGFKAGLDIYPGPFYFYTFAASVTNMATIKNIIFDLGGVLLNIDFNKASAAFKELGVENFDELYSKNAATELFEKLETGSISSNDFYAALQLHCYPGTGFQQIEAAWNAILIGFRKESVLHLPSLEEKYNLYLLSNTNIIHHAEFSRLFKKEIPGKPLEEYFIKAWYSHHIHFRKPHIEAYRFVLEQEKINPAETLFIDDSTANIEGAKQAGLQTCWLQASERIEKLGL